MVKLKTVGYAMVGITLRVMHPHAEREVYDDEVFVVGITLRVMPPHAEREVYDDEVFVVGITRRVMHPHAEREVYDDRDDFLEFRSSSLTSG